jgi:hypothetical protein
MKIHCQKMFNSKKIYITICHAFGLLPLFLFSSSNIAYAQLSENTNNQSTGNSNSFTITGSMIIGPNSTSIQENKDGATGVMNSSGGAAEGLTSGVSGMQRINFGEGTRYEVKIIPKSDTEICPNGTGIVTGCTIPEIGNANASSTGSTTTTMTVTSTQSAFINSFIKSFSAN